MLVMGKGRRERWMPIGDAVRSVLADYLLEREKLFPNTNALWVSEQGRTILPNGIFQILKRLGVKGDGILGHWGGAKVYQQRGHWPA